MQNITAPVFPVSETADKSVREEVNFFLQPPYAPAFDVFSELLTLTSIANPAHYVL